MVKNKSKTWKILQSDSEWIFSKGPIKKWCKDNNVKLQLSLPYMHHQNGQVESDVKRLFDKARTLMHYPLKRVPGVMLLNMQLISSIDLLIERIH